MREIQFSLYARDQIEERDLSLEQVMDAVTNPDQVVESGARRVAQKRMPEPGGYLLRVIYEEEAERVTAVTAYKTSKIAKYWRTE